MRKICCLLVSLFTLVSCNNFFPSSSVGVTVPGENSSQTSEQKENIVIDIYAINDFHGRIEEDKENNVPGISKLSTYLKEQKSKNEDGYVFINSGDYWQDTFDSSSNKGKLLTECLDVMECEVLALGNHEFDWGVDVISSNNELVSYTSFLGANIYSYPDNEKSSLGENYKIIERKGLKIGIIGGIGENQITSITSTVWEYLTFKNPVGVIKSLSDELRIEKGCDIVILSIHADEEDSYPQDITKISNVSGKRYVDAVFNAHSHQEEIKTYNGIPFIQGGSHGKQVSHVQLTYNDGKVKTTYCNNDGYGDINDYNEDPKINQIIDKYFDEEYLSYKNQKVGEIYSYGGFVSTSYSGKLQAKATYDYLVDLGYDVDIVINNGGRSSVSLNEAGKYTPVTREQIFNMTPFTNYTYLVSNIKGSDIYNECIKYTNPYYWSDLDKEFNQNETYTVACIDYMMLHKNKYRIYDYFKTYDKENIVYIIKDYPNVIMEKYLSKNKSINLNNYNGEHYTYLNA